MHQELKEKGKIPQATTTTSYDCEVCKDTELIYVTVDGQPTYKICECRERKKQQRMMKRSGIAGDFRKVGFKNFNTDDRPPILKVAKSTAITYCKEFYELKCKRQNSIAFLGQVGAGKTHLGIAICNNLMAKNIGVKYMQYREEIGKIKRVINDEEEYNKIIGEVKTATVLLIDDLFKRAGNEKKVNDADVRIMFEIINYRYVNYKPIIVSSEYTTDGLLDVDEALGSRIIEMTKGRIIEFQGRELNHRLL